MVSRGYPFDSVQMPLGPLDGQFRSFERRVLPALVERGIAPIAMKSLNGEARVVKDGVLTAREALTYAWSLPVSVLGSGIDSPRVLRENARIARELEPMDAAAREKLRRRCAGVAADGRYELYEVSKRFGGPPGRKQHGFPAELGE